MVHPPGNRLRHAHRKQHDPNVDMIVIKLIRQLRHVDALHEVAEVQHQAEGLGQDVDPEGGGRPCFAGSGARSGPGAQEDGAEREEEGPGDGAGDAVGLCDFVEVVRDVGVAGFEGFEVGGGGGVEGGVGEGGGC